MSVLWIMLFVFCSVNAYRKVKKYYGRRPQPIEAISAVSLIFIAGFSFLMAFNPADIVK